MERVKAKAGMTGRPKLSPDEVRRLFDLNSETGEIRWSKACSRGSLTHRVAGSNMNNGYRQVKIGGSTYLVHRVIWAIVYGVWPEKSIDHIDGNRHNNAVSNLRLVTASQNMQNLSVKGTASASGLMGAIHVPGNGRRRERWESRIRVAGGQKYLGSFKTPQEAHAAYMNAKALNHPYSSRH